MKKTLLALSFILVLISCKKDSTEQVDLSIKSITLSNSNLELLLGDSKTLTTTILPVEASSTPLFWSSSDSTIVQVNKVGKLVALKLGEATITVKNENGKVSSSCKLVVKPIVVKGITLDKTTATLIVGAKDKLHVAFEPANTTNQKIVWSTSDVSVVKIDNAGNVEAAGVGEATILATTEDNSATATCKITVSLPDITGLTIDKQNVQLAVNGQVQFVAITNPANAKPEQLIWSSLDINVATVTVSGVARAIKPGTAIIKVSNKAGTISATTELTVLPTKVSNIVLNKSVVGLLPGASETVTANVSPLIADNKTIIWKSSNTSVATVDQTGKISGLRLGTAVITAVPADGAAVSATCTVNVATIDKLVQVAAKPNNLQFSNAGNTSRLSVGIYNSTSSALTVKSLKIYVNGILNNTYNLTDPPLTSGSYVYDLGPFAISSGTFEMSQLMLGWTVQFEYELQGFKYISAAEVKRNAIGTVTSYDFMSSNNRSQNKPITISVRRSPSITSSL
ncbi:Ig-like domain-containing protein [Pedobacter sp. MC2016-15]|uniref:Ig-like domain-containing protein n=1 Tax=Pedobacter sp. MC2016-15 TaxID=2994473 RepID=UPI002245CABE|nr:Ig-like domain-containing protein [Pedobacter sp. MC2016-15]MCX2481631.1 Ig-like domain-containing protein [Pedobacter sp. MC2016-15]